MSKVVTANALATGRVVFLAGNGSWVEDLSAACRFPDADAADGALARVQGDVDKALIVEPFVVEVAEASPSGRPAMTLRDTIRAYGPTIDFLPIGANGA